jgi:hypothetical protein
MTILNKNGIAAKLIMPLLILAQLFSVLNRWIKK